MIKVMIKTDLKIEEGSKGYLKSMTNFDIIVTQHGKL